MASPLDQITQNAASGRRGVSVYAPVPRRAAAPAPPPRQIQRPASRSDKLLNAFLSSPKAQKEAEDEARKQAEANRPLWSKGLGIVLGNPVVGTALKGLEYLSYPRKAIQVGLSEAATHLPDWAEGGLTMLIDEDKVREDERSNWEKIRDPEFGWGQIQTPPSADDKGLGWLANRATALGGDLVTDPTTYVTGGAIKVAGAAGRSARAAEAASALQRLNDAYELANATGLDELGKRAAAAELAKAGEAYEAANAALIASQTGKRVAARANRAGRLQSVTEAAIYSPEIAERNAGELAAIAQGGYSKAVTPEVQQMLGLQPRALRFMGSDIPGTQRLASGLEKGVDVARTAANRSPLYYATRGSKYAEQPLLEVIGPKSGQGDTYRNLVALGMRGMSRQGREVEAIGNAILRRFKSSELNGLDANELEDLVYRAETSGVADPLNQVFSDVVDTYGQTTGRDISPFLQGRENYVPHVLTADAKRVMSGEDPLMAQVGKDLGFKTDDLLEGSGYLERSRKLVPGANGPKTYEIAGREITVKEGTIRELNQLLNEAFPELGGKFKFYQDNPEMIARAYIQSLSRGAGRDLAVQAVEDSANPLVRKVTGELEQERAAYQQSLDEANPVMNRIRAGDTRDEALTQPLPPKGTKPESEFFQAVPGQAATKQRWEYLVSEGRQFQKEIREGTKTRIGQLRDEVEEGRRPIMAELERSVAERPPVEAIDVAKKRINKLERVVRNTVKKRDATKEELAKLISDTETERNLLERELRRRESVFKGQATRTANRAEARARAEVEAEIDRLKAIENAAYERIGNTPDVNAVRQAVMERQAQLQKKLRQAEADYEANVTNRAAPYTNEQLKQARKVMKRAEDGVDQETWNNAVRVVTEMSEWEKAQSRLHQIYSRRVIAAEMEYKQRPNLGPLKVGDGYEIDLPGATEELALRAGHDIASGVRENPLPVEAQDIASAASRARIEAQMGREQAVQRSMTSQVQANQTRTAARRGPALADVRRRMVENAQQRIVITPATKHRVEFWENAVDNAMTKVSEAVADKDVLRAKVAKADRAARTWAKLNANGGPLKQRTMDDLVKNILDPMEAIVRANPDMSDEALNATEALLADAAERTLTITERDLSERQVKALIDAANDGTLAPALITGLNDNWKMLHSGVLAEGDTIVDAKLHDMLQNLYQLDKEPKWFGRTFNALTNLFKTYATLSPGFHVRNALSAVFMNTADGVPLRTQYEAVQLWNQFREGGQTWLRQQSQEIQDAFRVAFSSGAGGRYAEAGFAEPYANAETILGRFYNKAMGNRATRLSERAGTRVEGTVRLAPALDSIRQGESVGGALERVNRLHFDYADVSRLDENMKRVIPFWTFMSRNLPLQVSQIWTKPRVYQQYQNLVRNFSSEDPEFTPGYWKDSGAFNTGLTVPKTPIPILKEAGGLPVFAAPDLGFTRLQSDVADLEKALTGEQPSAILSNFNPLLTAPAEYVTRQDFYTGQVFPEDEGFQKQGGPLGVPITALAFLTGNTDEAGRVDPRFMNAIESINPLVGRAERLTPQLTGGDAEAKKRQTESLLRFLGLPIRTLTPKQQQNEALRRYYEALDEQRRQRDLATAS